MNKDLLLHVACFSKQITYEVRGMSVVVAVSHLTVFFFTGVVLLGKRNMVGIMHHLDIITSLKETACSRQRAPSVTLISYRTTHSQKSSSVYGKNRTVCWPCCHPESHTWRDKQCISVVFFIDFIVKSVSAVYSSIVDGDSSSTATAYAKSSCRQPFAVVDVVRKHRPRSALPSPIWTISANDKQIGAAPA